MKIKKMISTFLAACMLLTAIAIPSVAAPLSQDEVLSEYAGGTMLCAVYSLTESGVTERIVEVDIPEGTTKEEERKLADAAVFGSDVSLLSVSSVGSTNAVFDLVSYMTDLDMNYNIGTYVGGGTLTDSYLTAIVSFEHLHLYNNATKLNVELRNQTTNLSWNHTVSLTSSTPGRTYFTYVNSTNLSLQENFEFAVYAHPDAGYATADACWFYLSHQLY